MKKRERKKKKGTRCFFKGSSVLSETALNEMGGEKKTPYPSQ